MKIYQVIIHATSLEMLHELENYNLDLVRSIALKITGADYSVSGILSEEQVELLKKEGYSLEIELDASDIPAQRLQEVHQENRFRLFSNNNAENLTESVRGYLTVEQIDKTLLQIS